MSPLGWITNHIDLLDFPLWRAMFKGETWVFLWKCAFASTKVSTRRPGTRERDLSRLVPTTECLFMASVAACGFVGKPSK